MTISTVIVEDEPLAMERMREHVGRLPFLELHATFSNGLDALEHLRDHAVDLLFLDIKMGGLTGIDLLERLEAGSEVILTTAYPEFALKGYDLDVTDYLLKPFTFARFEQAVEKARANLASPTTRTDKSYIFIRTEYRLEKVLLDDILYIEGMRDYRRIHTLTKRIMTLQTFAELEQLLPPHRVCRVHKSFMVAPEKIDHVERNRVRIGDQLLPISDTYRKRFLELIATARH